MQDSVFIQHMKTMTVYCNCLVVAVLVVLLLLLLLVVVVVVAVVVSGGGGGGGGSGRRVLYSALSLNFVLGELRFRKYINHYYY